jgi:hypothetical protein
MALTLQDGLCDNLQALARPNEQCYTNGRINDSLDRICAGLQGGWQLVH